MKLRSDFSEALSKMHRLHCESGEERLAPIPFYQYQKWHSSCSSSSTSWWHWNDHWWISQINESQLPLNSIKYINTKNQLADILTKGNFTRDEWNHLLCLFNISHFSSTDCSEVVLKRKYKDSGEEKESQQNRSRSSRTEQHQRTGRPVEDASSSSY